ncbi:MAG TPA: carboxypeptidase regulatory-like domain-containing protein [Candidatus Acidoferrales bacterium]|nr:carboxypeptidase regulatory-like domain-containing protein [Candidatus Acidoferrales bacterium]
MSALLLILTLMLGTGGRRGQQRPTQTYQISGIVVDAASGAVVGGADVSITIAGEETQAPTGGDGRFVFRGLAPGKYPLYASAPGYVRQGYLQHGAYLTAIVVGSELDSQHIVFRLEPQAVIFGLVTDDRAEAVRGAEVMLIRAENGDRTSAPSLRSTTVTNDLGKYRFAYLLPGNYFVVVNARPWYAESRLEYLPAPRQAGRYGVLSNANRKPDPALDVVYPITYYPGVTDESAAEALSLAAGEQEEADIQLQAVPAVHVRVANLPADNKNGIYFQASQKIFGSLVQQLQYSSQGQVSPGEYEIAGLPPGRVTLVVRAGSGTEQSTQTLDANLGTGDILDAAVTEAGAKVSGTVIFPGGTVPAQGQVTLIDTQNGNFSASLRKDASFSFDTIPAGTYRVMLGLPVSDAYVREVSASGARISGRRVTLGSASDVRLSITMARGVGQVTGVAKLDGKPTAGLMVLAVPESGMNLEQDSRMDQSDSDGTFSLGNIVPGKYILMAIKDGWSLQWRRPGALKPYLAKGLQISIAPGEAAKVSVDAQRPAH